MAVAWGQIAGQVVFDSAWCPLAEEHSAGFSGVGTRTVLLTDYPAVYVHDTGGLGGAFVAVLAPAADPAATVALVERSTRLRVDLRLPAGRAFRATTPAPLLPQVIANLTNLRGRLLPGSAPARFVSPCAVSITPQYDSGPAEAGELLAYVVVRQGRLELRYGGTTLVDWPVNRIMAAGAGPDSVRLRGGAVLNGRLLGGMTLHLGTTPVRDALLAALGPARSGGDQVQVSVPVSVRGLDQAADRTDCDCVLGESALELQSRDTSAVLARFDLGDPRLRVAGSAEQFVVFHPEPGPVAVQSGPEAFGRRLYTHPGVVAAAERTLATGPYPAELPDGRPVACAVTADALRVKGRGTDLKVPFAGIRRVAADPGDGRAHLRIDAEPTGVTVAGQLELVQALHADLLAGSHATVPPGRLPDLLRAAVALEEDYLLAVVFGPCYELHAALLSERAGAGPVPGQGLHTPVRLPGSEAERVRLAAMLREGLGELERHFDLIGVALPGFFRDRDAALLAPVTGTEPPWLKKQEAQLRQAMAPLPRAASEVGALSAQLSRLVELDPSALPRPGYAGAAVSLGAAALLNPVFMVAGAGQAYHQYSQGEQRKAELTARSERGWAQALERWQALIDTVLPVLAYVLTESVFGVRWEAARRITEELRALPEDRRASAQRGVARRLARLDVLRRYPSGAGIHLRRGEIAAHLRRARDAVSTPRLVEF